MYAALLNTVTSQHRICCPKKQGMKVLFQDLQSVFGIPRLILQSDLQCLRR